MIKQPDVSVILPVFNVEKYLNQCLDSLLKQELANIEIICVNDGSTDCSSEILQKYAHKDPRVIVMEQPNRGAGAARNRGLTAATGKYLSFLDSDDFFEPSMLSEAFSAIEKTNTDVVIYRADHYLETERRFLATPWMLKLQQFPMTEVFAPQDIAPNIFRSTIGWTWDKLFRRKFIIENNLKFQEIKIHNDMLFTYSALLLASRLTILDKVLVHQRKRGGGSLSDSDTKSRELHCFVEALEAVRDMLVTNDLYERFGREFVNYEWDLCLYHLDTADPEGKSMLLSKLSDEWIDRLGIANHDEDFFFDKKSFERLQEVMKTNTTCDAPKAKQDWRILLRKLFARKQ